MSVRATEGMRRAGATARVVMLTAALLMAIGCHTLRGRQPATSAQAAAPSNPAPTPDAPPEEAPPVEEAPELIVPPTLTEDDAGDSTFRRIEVARGANPKPNPEGGPRLVRVEAPAVKPQQPTPKQPVARSPSPPASPTEMTGVVALASQLLQNAAAPLPGGWRCSDEQMKALEDPEKAARLKAESDLLARWHWKTIGEMIPAMERSDQTWPEIRWIYIKDGVCEPEMFVLAGIMPHRFLGHSLYVHATMARKLEKAEELLKRKKFKPRFRYIGSFTPRTVRGPGAKPGRISHHAYGMAIDVDPMTNPYFSRTELELIEEISGVRLERGRNKSAALRWKIFDRASKRYKKRVGRWIRKEQAKVKKYERRARRGSKSKRRAARRSLRQHKRRLKLVTQGHHLTQARKTGLTTLPKVFVMSMEKAGLSWGTHFPSGADMMHFATPGQP